ncbi:MAG: hypothetical protein NT126_10450 [Bacteroidetes bacterium]|nr:hypothetical protein [Bacteroidota bacterium]
MKKIISLEKIALIVFLFVTLNGYGQNFNVQSAADSYKDLQFTKTNRLKDLSDAKRYIDLAYANEQTSNDPKMWIYRGKIYLEIDRDTNEVIRNLDPDAIEKSGTSFINCEKTDTKKNYSEDCNNLIWVSGIRLFNKAVAGLNKGEFEKATRYFNLAMEIIPFDKDNNLKRNTITPDLITYNLAKTAIKSKDHEKAKSYLQKLIDSKYNDPMIYIYMDRACLEQKDTAKALTYIDQGRKVFEENPTLLNEEIRIYSLQGKFDILISKFTDAIAIDDTREMLYYNRGLLYENQKDDQHAQADFMKAIELKPDYFDANYALGTLLFNQAADMANTANTIKSNDEFDKAKKKYELRFKEAEPYLEKSLELNLRKTDEEKGVYKSNLNSLKQLYVRLGEMEKSNKMKAALQELN